MLSSTVASGLEFYQIPDTEETVKFIRIFDRVFDCLNGRSVLECKHRRKPDLRPYKSIDDDRLQVSKMYNYVHYSTIEYRE